MYSLSPALNEFIVKSSSGGDLALEKYLYEQFPTISSLAQLMANSKQIYILNIQGLLVDLALDKSANLVDYFTHNRTMVSDTTQLTKTIGDGETDNYRNAMSRLKDRENSWNRVEREGSEDSKNYHYSVSKGKSVEDGKGYDFSHNDNRTRSCSYDTSISQTKGKGDSLDVSTLTRKSSSLSRTANVDPCPFPAVNGGTFSEFYKGGKTVKYEWVGGVNVSMDLNEVPRVLSLSIDGSYPGCSETPATDDDKEIKCAPKVNSCGQGYRENIDWNWSASMSAGLPGNNASVNTGASGGGNFGSAFSFRTDQVCSSAVSSVDGKSYGHNNYDQTDSSYAKGSTKSWGEGQNLRNSGGYNIGERVSYSRSKGEIKGLIEFCTQSDSASRKRRVSSGSVDGIAKTWARTVTTSRGETNKITNSDTSVIYWNQQVKNLSVLRKLINKRLKEQEEIASKQFGTVSESNLFNLCTYESWADQKGLCYG